MFSDQSIPQNRCNVRSSSLDRRPAASAATTPAYVVATNSSAGRPSRRPSSSRYLAQRLHEMACSGAALASCHAAHRSGSASPDGRLFGLAGVGVREVVGVADGGRVVGRSLRQRRRGNIVLQRARQSTPQRISTWGVPWRSPETLAPPAA